MAKAQPTAALIRNVLDAWKQHSGLPVGGVEVRPDGTVRVLAPIEALRIASADAAGKTTCDGAFG